MFIVARFGFIFGPYFVLFIWLENKTEQSNKNKPVATLTAIHYNILKRFLLEYVKQNLAETFMLFPEFTLTT